MPWRLLRPGTSSKQSGLRSGRGCIQNTVHAHGYTRTRGARRRSHRTHARAATADRTHRDRPSTRLKSTPAASEHIACLCGLGQASHSTDASTAVYSPLPLPTPRTKRPERRPHVSLGIVAPCVCPPKQRIHPSSFHVNARTDPDHTGVNSPQLSCTDGSEKDMHNGRKCSRPAQSTRAKEAAARGAAARLLSIGATLRASGS